MEEQIADLIKVVRGLEMQVRFLEKREITNIDLRNDERRLGIELSRQLAKRIRFLEAMYFLMAAALITHFIGHILASYGS